MMLPKAWRKYSNPTKSKSPGLVEALNVLSDPSVIMHVALARQRCPKLGFLIIRSPSFRSPNNICVDLRHTAQSV